MKDKIKQILTNFENVPSEQIIESLNQIKTHFKNDLTRNYLQSKIDAVLNSNDEFERKKLCKNLIPYLDWYMQGN